MKQEHPISLSDNLELLPIPESVKKSIPLYTKWLSSLKELFDLKRDEFGASREFIEWVKPLFQFLYQVYFRVELEGVNNIPAKGPVILVANHSGTLPYDGAMTHIGVYNEHKNKRTVKFLVDSFAWNIPMLGGVLERLGGVIASFDSAEKLLRRNQVVMLFPEGVGGIGKTFDERYKLRPFTKTGFVRLAIKSKATIVPMAIVGAEEIHPVVHKYETLGKLFGLPYIPITPTFPWLGPLGLVPLPSKWKISFLKPIKITGPRSKKRFDEDFFANEAKKVQTLIQKKLNSMLARRNSIWK